MQDLEAEDDCLRKTFRQKVASRAALRGEGDVELVWGSLKDCLLEVADEVGGRAKGSQIHRQTWWWNEKVAAAIRRKQTLFGSYSRFENLRE